MHASTRRSSDGLRCEAAERLDVMLGKESRAIVHSAASSVVPKMVMQVSTQSPNMMGWPTSEASARLRKAWYTMVSAGFSGRSQGVQACRHRAAGF